MGKGVKETAPPHAAAAAEPRPPKSASKKRRSEDSDALAVPSGVTQVRWRRGLRLAPTAVEMASSAGAEPPPPPRARPQTPAELFCGRVSEHSAFFDHLVSLVPARFYLPAEAEPDSVRFAAPQSGCAPRTPRARPAH